MPLSPIEQLPAELLLKILSNLDYGTLKYTIPFISRRFKETIAPDLPAVRTRHPEDYILFRDKPLPRFHSPSTVEFELHPRLKPRFATTQSFVNEQPRITLRCTKLLKDFEKDAEYVKALTETLSTFTVDKYSSGIYLENAISPSVTSLRVASRKISNKNGVSVGDVVLADIYNFIKFAESRRSALMTHYLALLMHVKQRFNAALLAIARGQKRAAQPDCTQDDVDECSYLLQLYISFFKVLRIVQEQLKHLDRGMEEATCSTQ